MYSKLVIFTYIYINIFLNIDNIKLFKENVDNDSYILNMSRSSSNATLNENDNVFEDSRDFDKNNERSIHFEILSNPEFLAEGTAVNDILNPDRILIGGLPTKKGLVAQDLLCKLYSYWIPEEKIIKMGLWSAELSKLVSNYNYIKFN